MHPWWNQRPAWPAEEGAHDNQCNVGNYKEREGPENPLAIGWTAAGVSIEIRDQEQREHHQGGRDYSAEYGGVADEFLQSEEVPRCFGGIGSLCRIGELFEGRVEEQ